MNMRRVITAGTTLWHSDPAALEEWLQQRLRDAPRCPVARYLAGCVGFDRGRSAIGVRHMMVAHHAEPQLQSAALLAFAGLTWVGRRGVALLPVLLETWEAFRRPAFDRYPIERRLLDALDVPAPELAHAGATAQRLWRLPIRLLRQQLREAVVSRDAALYPLLSVAV